MFVPFSGLFFEDQLKKGRTLHLKPSDYGIVTGIDLFKSSPDVICRKKKNK